MVDRRHRHALLQLSSPLCREFQRVLFAAHAGLMVVDLARLRNRTARAHRSSALAVIVGFYLFSIERIACGLARGSAGKCNPRRPAERRKNIFCVALDELPTGG